MSAPRRMRVTFPGLCEAPISQAESPSCTMSRTHLILCHSRALNVDSFSKSLSPALRSCCSSSLLKYSVSACPMASLEPTIPLRIMSVLHSLTTFRSSKGVVECARRIIERNDPQRLQKTMVSSYSQPFERSDILCLTFTDPNEEANWIAYKIRSVIGTPFHDKSDEPERGLSWSDCAILLRSVRRNAGPILEALERSGISYVVRGMNDLFGTAEAEAARAIFLYMANQIEEGRLRELRIDANLGLSEKELDFF